MIVDFAIHNNEGNPHSHIMLTTRHVTPEGFGNKNRDWDKEENLLIWRENWAKITNRKFEEKGLAGRIDHRTLKAQVMPQISLLPNSNTFMSKPKTIVCILHDLE